MGKVTLNPDLKREREKGTFDTEELTNLIDGGKIKTQERRELVEFFAKDPAFKDEVPPEYLSYVDRYEESVRKSCLMFYKINDWMDHKRAGGSVDVYQSNGPTICQSCTEDSGDDCPTPRLDVGVMMDRFGSEDSDNAEKPDQTGVEGFYSLHNTLKALLGGMLGSAVLKDGMPFALHYVMFVPTLMGQGTMDQQAYWIGKAWNCSIMGTYAQTELGHGTFIRGLETTAHFDPETEEFVLNSPTLTSYKWWPGGLGHTANYAIVLAQLHTKGVCYGIHAFIVQLRDEETHMPLKGIKIGEIGCKLGMNGTNQGFLGFDHVRIPRDHMLMKNSQVLPDGTYVKSVSDKLTYGTMIFVRVALIRGVAAAYLSKAVTIATRYSAVRHQSELIPGEGEPIILEYRTQQYKLLPNIAASIGIMFASQWLWDMYNNVTSELEQGDIERLPELHAISCCLKSISTSDAARGIEECRKACGGHGYMTCSSFPVTYGMATAAETYEGENTVLLLQTARYLLKANSMAKGGNSMSPTVKYLSITHQMRVPWSNTITSLITAYRQVAQGLINETYEKVERLVASGTPSELAANHYSIQLVKCAEAHCRLFLVEKYFEAVKNAQVSPPLKKVLNELSLLYSVYYLLKDLGLFLSYSNVRVSDVTSIEDWQNTLLAALRPNAVAIVDSFDISDEILSSPLGAYDGDVYKRLMDEAMKSPLNKEPVNASFEKYLKPFLKSNM